jgi:hypothetical protein
VEETAFITRHGGKQEIISLGNMSLKQLLRWHIRACLLVFVSEQEAKSNGNKLLFLYFRVGIISHTAWCPMPGYAAISVTVNLRIRLRKASPFCSLILFVTLLCRPLCGWSEICFRLHRVYNPPFDNAVAHAGISVHTMKLQVSCSSQGIQALYVPESTCRSLTATDRTYRVLRVYLKVSGLSR